MDNLLALGAATAVLVLIPGPNVALIVASSLRYGLAAGLITVLGTTLGVALQLSLVIAGMAALIGAAAVVLSWVKWLGVAYLAYLGITTWLETPSDLEAVQPRPRTTRRAFWRGAGFAFVNPKTLLFNAAFLPQFVTPGTDITGQLVALAAVFLLVVSVGDSLWAACASSARPILRRCGSIRNKLTGGLLCGAALGLAVARRSA